jgi:hypothetical protein
MSLRESDAPAMAPPAAAPEERPLVQYRRHPAARRLFRRGPWENFATVVIAVGIVMLMQPWLLSLYTYSFLTILAGTVLFTAVARFPD